MEWCNAFAFNENLLSWELFVCFVLFLSLCHTPFRSCTTKVSRICRYEFVSFCRMCSFFYYFVISLAYYKNEMCVKEARTAVCAVRVSALVLFCLRLFKWRAFEILFCRGGSWRFEPGSWGRSVLKRCAWLVWDRCARFESHHTYLSCLFARWNLVAYKGFSFFRHFFIVFLRRLAFSL